MYKVENHVVHQFVSILLRIIWLKNLYKIYGFNVNQKSPLIRNNNKIMTYEARVKSQSFFARILLNEIEHHDWIQVGLVQLNFHLSGNNS